MSRRVDWYLVKQYIASWAFQPWNVGKLPAVNTAQRPWTSESSKINKMEAQAGPFGRCHHLLSHTTPCHRFQSKWGFTPYCKSSFRRFEGIKLLHIQGDNLVQTEAEIVAKKECVDCVKRL